MKKMLLVILSDIHDLVNLKSITKKLDDHEKYWSK